MFSSISGYLWRTPSGDKDKQAKEGTDVKKTTSDESSTTSKSDDALIEQLSLNAQERKSVVEGPASPDPKSLSELKLKAPELKLPEGLVPATTLKRLVDKTSTNCFAEPDALAFKVRGENYLEDKIKITAPAAYTLIGVDLYKCEALPEHIAARKDAFVQQLRLNALKKNEKPPFIFLVNFLLPWGAFVCYWTPGTPSPTIGHAAFDKALTAFMNGDDEYRNTRWKFIPRMIEGNWGIKKTIGENTPVIISKRITHKYFKGEGYFEVDCDITSSRVARGILGMVQAYVTKVVLDMVVVVEGQTPEELPEKILGGVRFVKLDVDNAPKLPVPTVTKAPESLVGDEDGQDD